MKPTKAESPFDFSMQVRTSNLPKFALDHVVLRLKRGGVEFKGKRVTQEAVINATFLMLDAMPDDQLVAALSPHVAALDAALPEIAGRVKGPAKEVVVTPDSTKEQPSAAAKRGRKRDA